jgi:Rap1a immunity proteins
MMKRLTLVAAVGLAASTSLGSAAQPIALHVRTAGDLAALCSPDPRSPGADAKINYCDGFAQGVVDLELRHAGDKKPFCFSPGTSRRTTMVQFSEWVRSLPAHGSLEATDGLFQFLGDRFPCK